MEIKTEGVSYQEISRNSRGGVRIEITCSCGATTRTWLWSFCGSGKKCSGCSDVISRFGRREKVSNSAKPKG